MANISAGLFCRELMKESNASFMPSRKLLLPPNDCSTMSTILFLRSSRLTIISLSLASVCTHTHTVTGRDVTQEQGVGVALHTHLHQRQPARFDVGHEARAQRCMGAH